MSDRREINKPEIEIDAGLLAQFEELPSTIKRMDWTKEKDALLLKFWPEKRKTDVARLLKTSQETCRKRWLKLTTEREG